MANSQYKPPRYLVTGSSLSEKDIVSQFEDFKGSLEHVVIAPQLVFERMMGNLNGAYMAALDRERSGYAETLRARQAEQAAAMQVRAVEHAKEFQQLKVKHDIVQAALGRLRKEAQNAKNQAAARGGVGPSDGKASEATAATTGGAIVIRSSRTDSLAGPQLSQQPIAPAVPVKLMFQFDGNGIGMVVLAVKHYPDLDTIYGPRSTWHDVSFTDRDQNIQEGSFSTLTHVKRGEMRSKNSWVATFSSPFSKPPAVIVWLTGFDMECGKPWRVKAFATNITETGFTINIDTWQDSVLYSAGVAWIAYPGDDPHIATSQFDILGDDQWRVPLRRKCQRQSYEALPDTDRVSRHLMTINSIEIENGPNISALICFEDISYNGGFRWGLDVGPENVRLYSIGITYVNLG